MGWLLLIGLGVEIAMKTFKLLFNPVAFFVA